MLILVGVTVTVALNGGLFEKARQGAKETEIERQKEELTLAIASAYDVTNGIIKQSDLKNALGEGWNVEGVEGEEGAPYNCTIGENEYIVCENGKILIVDYAKLEQIFSTSDVDALKEELQINSDASTGEFIISFCDNLDMLFCYFYESGIMFRMTVTDEGDIENVELAGKTTNAEAYKMARKLRKVKAELDNIFLGKTEDEMIEKYKEGKLEVNLSNQSTIKFEVSEDKDISGNVINEKLRVEKLMLVLDKNEIDFCERNSIYLVVNEDGIYNNISFELGN